MDIQIPFEAKYLAGVLHSPTSDCQATDYGVILTHGAGGDLTHHQLDKLAKDMCEQGFNTLRFTCKGLNIKYRTRVFSGVIQFFQKYCNKGIFVGGRSMGSRAALHASLDYEKDDVVPLCGIICLAYPLHPPQQHNNLRDEPLLASSSPCYFISGTKDEMADRVLLKAVIDKMTCAVHIDWIEGADHGHKVKGTSINDIDGEISAKVIAWCRNIIAGYKVDDTVSDKGIKRKSVLSEKSKHKEQHQKRKR